MLRKRKVSCEEKEEIERSIELADLAKPVIKDGLDITLFTQKELDLIGELEVEHDRLFRKRAENLKFYPYVLNESESRAVLRCMTYAELRPFFEILSIQEKNRRLQSMLALEKVHARALRRINKD
jgi:hypothetical protein